MARIIEHICSSGFSSGSQTKAQSWDQYTILGWRKCFEFVTAPSQSTWHPHYDHKLTMSWTASTDCVTAVWAATWSNWIFKTGWLRSIHSYFSVSDVHSFLEICVYQNTSNYQTKIDAAYCPSAMRLLPMHNFVNTSPLNFTRQLLDGIAWNLICSIFAIILQLVNLGCILLCHYLT